jgi:hypothetical protein
MARGFSAEMLSDLMLAELATVVTEPIRARRGLMIRIERIRITDAGRRALEEWAIAKALGIGRASRLPSARSDRLGH